MDIKLLNGFDFQQPTQEVALNGFRMNPSMNGVRMDPLNGFRMNPSSLNAISLNALATEAELWLNDVMMGDPVAINGFKEWRARRQAKKAEKRGQRSRRQEAKTTRKERRAQEGGFASRLLDIGEGFVEGQMGNVQALADMTGAEITQAVEDAGGEVQDKGLFKRKTWWEKRSGVEKAAIIGGPILLGLGIWLAVRAGKKKTKRRR